MIVRNANYILKLKYKFVTQQTRGCKEKEALSYCVKITKKLKCIFENTLETGFIRNVNECQ